MTWRIQIKECREFVNKFDSSNIDCDIIKRQKNVRLCNLIKRRKNMNSEYEYNQEVKKKVRQETLTYIIEKLTVKRSEAACVRKTYVRELFNWLTSQNYDSKSRDLAKKIPVEYITLWEEFHDSFLGQKKPSELTVCYLSGSQPMNDFEVLVESGIHPHNIWAFEVDKGTYNNALNNIDSSDFPMLKLHKGSIEQFFVTTPKKFDIVYLDFCGSIPSTQHTTRIIASLFKHQRLNSPGALITNIALPDISKPSELNKYAELVSSYLFSKDYLEGENGQPIENTIRNFEEFKKEVINNFEGFYSQFITRQILDISTIITPWVRLATSSLWNKYFKSKPNEISKSLYKAKMYSLNKTLESINRAQKEQREFGLKWINEMSGFPESNIVISDIIGSYNVLKANSDFYTENMSKVIDEYLYEEKMFQFCDRPNKNLAFDLLTNQLSYPMHYSTNAILRKSYQAKQTKMFTDAIIFDEVRYIYEWLPTIDLLNNAFENIGQQLTYRFALDGLVKNRMWYNPEYFYSGSVVSIHDNESFNANTIAKREEIIVKE